VEGRGKASDPNPTDGARLVLDAKLLYAAYYACIKNDTKQNSMRVLTVQHKDKSLTRRRRVWF